MKVLLSSFFVFFLLLFALACGGGGSGDGDSPALLLAPNSIADRIYTFQVISGIAPLANTGTALMAFNSDGTYFIVGDGYNTSDDLGNYNYSKTSDNSANLSIRSASNNLEIIDVLTYSELGKGTYSASFNSSTQTGLFQEASGSGLAPSSIAGKSYKTIVTSGVPPFAEAGSATVTFSSDGTYSTIGDGVNVSNDSGTFTYTVLKSNNAGQINFNSSVFAKNTTYKLIYTEAGKGGFAAVSGSSGQTGSFQEI